MVCQHVPMGAITYRLSYRVRKSLFGLLTVDQSITVVNFALYRKDQATPEDIDYFECQQEMVQELYQQHMHVERVIGKLFHVLKSFRCNIKKTDYVEVLLWHYVSQRVVISFIL